MRALIAIPVAFLLLAAPALPAASPGRIAFAARGVVWTSAPDGTGLARLRGGSWPDWSPNGKQIAYAGAGGIFVMNANGSRPRRITRGLDLQPDWSPDGKRIAFARIKPRYGTEIEIVGVDGKGLGAVTNDHNQNLDPAWVPDGTLISWDRVSTAVRFQRPRIVAARLDGKIVIRLGAGSAPAWSPRGGQIAFTGVDGAVWVESVQGTKRQRLTAAAAGSRPAWSPDGARIAYVAEQSGRTDIWTMSADGTAQRQFTRLGATAPDWGR